MSESTTAFRASKLQDWELQAAKNLKTLFELADISQKMAGAKWGIGTAGMVSQYVNGKRPLGLQAAIKFAKGLEVNVGAISPTLAAQLPQSNEPPQHFKQNHPLAQTKQAQEATNCVTTLGECMAFLAAYLEKLAPGDRVAALDMMARLANEPEAAGKVAKSIEAMASEAFARQAQKAA